MTVLIVIHYISNDNKVFRRGSFPLRGKTKEVVALEFWKWIKREMPFECEIEKITCDGEDITEKVIEMEKAPLD
jgi:excinuclease UvrABC helicase subunit UvrB